jgi:YVTN family beta-propeller protein
MPLRVTLPTLLLILLASCAEKNEVVQPPHTTAGKYSTEIQPIFDRSCGSADCHGGGPRGFAGGMDLSSYAGLFRGSRYGTVVTPGSAFMSPLMHVINWGDTTLSPVADARMPVGRNELSRGDQLTIARWIDAGAPDDNGQSPFAVPGPGGRLYFTSQFVDMVGVIDLSTGLIARYVSAGNPLPITQATLSPHLVQIDDQGKYYYVTLINDTRLRKYDAATHRLLGEAVVGTSPAHVVVTPDGQDAYVTNFNSTVGRVYHVKTATMTVANVISVPGVFMLGTHGARISQDGRYLYVTATASDNVTVIQTSNDSLITQIRVVNDGQIVSGMYVPYQVAVRNDDSLLFVTLSCPTLGIPGAVSIIRRSGDQFTLEDTVRVGRRPLQCEVTPDGRYLYVANQVSGSVSVLDAHTGAVVTTIANVGTQPHGVDISQDSRTVFVTLENQGGVDPPHHPTVGGKSPGFIAFIDVATQQVYRRVEVGGFAAGICVYPGRGN